MCSLSVKNTWGHTKTHTVWSIPSEIQCTKYLSSWHKQVAMSVSVNMDKTLPKVQQQHIILQRSNCLSQTVFSQFAGTWYIKQSSSVSSDLIEASHLFNSETVISLGSRGSFILIEPPDHCKKVCLQGEKERRLCFGNTWTLVKPPYNTYALYSSTVIIWALC